MDQDTVKKDTTIAAADAAAEAVPTASEPNDIDARLAALGMDKSLYEEPKYWDLQKKRFKKYRKVLWFLIPAAAFSFIFSYIPMLGILFSFLDPKVFNLVRHDIWWNLVNGRWTFQNYIDIFAGADAGKFFLSIGNTLLINVIRLVICFPLSIFIAVQLSELKNQGVAKLILIILCIPNFLSWAIVIGIWSGLLDSSGGALNNLLVTLKLNQPDYFLMGKNHLFKGFAIFLSAWKGAGWGSIMFYAGIVSIDKTFYEAATLEGANRLHKMWYLTIPMILPTIALMLVMNISGMMAAGFEQIYTMMQVSAELVEKQVTLDTYIYEISIVTKGQIPFSTALGVFNGLIALILMIVGNKITTKTLHRGLW